jgi:hypothetical protein
MTWANHTGFVGSQTTVWGKGGLAAKDKFLTKSIFCQLSKHIILKSFPGPLSKHIILKSFPGPQ